MNKTDQNEKAAWKKRYIKLTCLLALFFLVFYWASGEQLFYTSKTVPSIAAEANAAIMEEGTTVDFSFQPQSAFIDNLTILIGTYARSNEGTLTVQMLDHAGTQLAEKSVGLSTLKDYEYYVCQWDEPVAVSQEQNVTIRMQTTGVPQGQGVSLWYGTKIQTVRLSVTDTTATGYNVNGEARIGKICYNVNGRTPFWFGTWYWPIVLLFFVFFGLYGIKLFSCLKTGKTCLLLSFYNNYHSYKFLIKQLVSRDFKRKYKRSVLGAFWSLLNPLLTMLVQYLVFSTIFKSSIENFIVYLLCGIIIFNFFGEAISLGLSSIVDNASLINKVYMPKEIYPLSRVLSSVVNLILSLIPMLLVTIFSGVKLTKAVFLLPIGLFWLFVFSLGLAYLLSSSMVFFRDTLFLWNVFFVLWSYLTPTFYPLSIIPAAFQTIFKLNPMYQYIAFTRTILMYGIAPAPSAYIGCILSAVVMLAIGLTAFRKNQNKFVLHL